MENNQTGPHGDSHIPQPPPPTFLDSNTPAQPVVQLSPFRHVSWIRQAFGTRGQYRQELRILILTIVFAFAGGATGGMVAAFSQYFNREEAAASPPTEVNNAVAPDETLQADTSSNPTFSSNVNNGREKDKPTLANVTRRRFVPRPGSRERLIAIYNDLGFDLDAPPPKKKHGKKDMYDY